MKSLVFVSKKGQKFKVTIPDPKPNLVSAYLFAFPRSGSTLLNNMVEAYCQFIDVPHFSLFNAAFDQGVSTNDIQDDAAVCFQQTGYIYTGFRHFPKFKFDVTGAPTIWLTRDPRDMLVSHYFSVLKSHVIPTGLLSFAKRREEVKQMDVNQYVIQKAQTLALQFRHYQKMLSRSDVKIYRYEDVIYKKEEWLTDVVAKLGLEQNRELVSNITKQFDVIPDIENEYNHVRQVHPGNHTKKLTSQTIQELNTVLSGFLKYFDYEY